MISASGSHAPRELLLLARFVFGAAFLAYFAFTAILYFWGPWDYPMTHGSGKLIAFLVAVHVAFAVGYVVGVRGTPAVARAGVSIETLVLVAAIAELLLLFPTSAYSTGRWFPSPWVAARDLATTYTDSLARRETGTPYVNYVRMLLAPLLALAVPLGVFYWCRLSLRTRLLFVASVVGTIALFIAMGANAGAAHWMGLFPWFVLAGHLSGVNRLDTKVWVSAGTVLVLSAIVFFVVFSATMVQRTGSFAMDGRIPGIGATLDRSSAPGALEARSDLQVGADGLAGYLSQGYFGVYLSLQEPFVPCYGVGNSMFLQRQAARVTGDARFLQCAYPMRIQATGWQPSMYWATIYPWIASDVTFPGTVLVVFLLGWLAGRVWLDVLGGENLFAVALLGQVLLLLYYVPGHNKVMHSGEGVFAFAVLLAAWVTSRRHPVQPALQH